MSLNCLSIAPPKTGDCSKTKYVLCHPVSRYVDVVKHPYNSMKAALVSSFKRRPVGLFIVSREIFYFEDKNSGNEVKLKRRSRW